MVGDAKQMGWIHYVHKMFSALKRNNEIEIIVWNKFYPPLHKSGDFSEELLPLIKLKYNKIQATKHKLKYQGK